MGHIYIWFGTGSRFSLAAGKGLVFFLFGVQELPTA